MEINVVKCFSSRKLLAAMPFTHIIGKGGIRQLKLPKALLTSMESEYRVV